MKTSKVKVFRLEDDEVEFDPNEDFKDLKSNPWLNQQANKNLPEPLKPGYENDKFINP